MANVKNIFTFKKMQVIKKSYFFLRSFDNGSNYNRRLFKDWV